MTVPVSDRQSQLYVGNGVNTRFDFTFRVFNQEDESGVIVRVKNGTEFENMDKSTYQVYVNQGETGGYVTFNTAPDSQTFFYIIGGTPIDQLLDITNYDNFYPDAIERALDKLTAILQEWNYLLSSEVQSRILSDIDYDQLAQVRENELKAYIDGLVASINGDSMLGTQFITYVNSISDLQYLLKWSGRTAYVKSIEKNYTYKPNLTIPENGVTVVGKWEMQIQEAYYASWFCPDSSIDNVNEPQTANIEIGYRYATDKGREFIIDQVYYVESTVHNALNSYPPLVGNDSLHYAIRVLSNSVLKFIKGVGKLKLVPNTDTHSRVLCVFDIKNYKIVSPWCIGDKDQHLGTTGEQHYMIAFHASKNGYVSDPVCENSWGDGFYFGYPEYVSVFNVDVDYPTDLVIDNANIENSSRNGISLCGAENLTINNPIIDVVDRVAPVAGIDIEPEEDFVYSGKRMHLKNVRIHNATIKNCNNYGVIAFIYGNREVDVKFTGTTTFKSKAPYYCSFPIWFASYQGDNVADYSASGSVSFEKVIMDDKGAQWDIVAPISFYSANAAIRLSIESMLIESSRNALQFNFTNPTIVTADFNGGLDVKNIELHKKYDLVQLNQAASSKKLRYVDLPIPSYLQVQYTSNAFLFENNVNIGGYARLNSKGWYNTNELINNTIFTPKVNPDDGNSVQARIYDLGEMSNGRTMVYSLESGLTTPQIGDGLYVHCGRLIRYTSPLSTATCEFQSNGVRKLKSSFGNFTIY